MIECNTNVRLCYNLLFFELIFQFRLNDELFYITSLRSVTVGSIFNSTPLACAFGVRIYHLSFIIFHLAELCFALTKRYIIIQFLQICLTWFQVLAFLRSFVKHWLTGFVVEDDAVGFCYHSEGIGNSEEGEMG